MTKKEKNKTTVGAETKKILEKENYQYEVGEIIDEYSKSYVDEVRKAVEENASKFESPFHIVVLHKKEPWALNVLRSWFIGRQTRPDIKEMWTNYRNFMHTVYMVDAVKGNIELLYTLPSPQEAEVILKNWYLYDPNLVRWCHRGFEELKKPTLPIAA